MHPVEMFREPENPSPGKRDRLSCSLAHWQLLREIGVTFGWQPLGTTYLPFASGKGEAHALRDYEPGNALDAKYVEREDAARWAASLRAAKQQPRFLAGIQKNHGAEVIEIEADETIANLVDEFIEFAGAGPFAFAIAANRD
jgi:hypothetical protein